MNQWVGYHKYWIKRSKDEEIPLYFIRFEDMINDPKPVLTELFQFCLNMPTLEGSVIEERINFVLSKGETAT